MNNPKIQRQVNHRDAFQYSLEGYALNARLGTLGVAGGLRVLAVNNFSLER